MLTFDKLSKLCFFDVLFLFLFKYMSFRYAALWFNICMSTAIPVIIFSHRVDPSLISPTCQPPSPLVTTNLISVSVSFFLFYFFHWFCSLRFDMNEIIWYLSFSVWLILLSVIPSSFIHVVTNIMTFLWLSNIPLCMYVTKSKFILLSTWLAKKLREKLLGQGIQIVFEKSMDWEDGALVSQRTNFLKLEFRLIYGKREGNIKMQTLLFLQLCTWVWSQCSYKLSIK